MISICYDGEKKSDLETLTRAVLDYVREEKKVLGGKKKFWETFRKPKLLGSWGSTVARLKLKGIDGRAPPGAEPAA